MKVNGYRAPPGEGNTGVLSGCLSGLAVWLLAVWVIACLAGSSELDCLAAWLAGCQWLRGRLQQTGNGGEGTQKLHFRSCNT